ncbi:MAG: hypothetical protein WCP26_13955 [Actinomycetes bacterium]
MGAPDAESLRGAISLLIAAGVLGWYLTTDDVPPQFALIAPYLATLLVLAFATQRRPMPAADGQPYLNGEEH